MTHDQFVAVVSPDVVFVVDVDVVVVEEGTIGIEEPSMSLKSMMIVVR